MRSILFTDLDGTLLDPYTYSYQGSLETVRLLQENKVPIIFCSAKTRTEQQVYREALGITDPFIVEEGGAILIPRGYFPFDFEYHRRIRGYALIELGLPYAQIVPILNRIKENSPCRIVGFGDLQAEEVARDSGLSLRMARLAKKREYTETLKIEGPEEEVRRFLQRVEEEGLSWTKGERYYRVKGKSSKGEAAGILLGLFQKAFGEIKSIAIGNSLNDRSLLEVVDIPLLLQKPSGGWEKMELPGLHLIQGLGPTGWSGAIKSLWPRLKLNSPADAAA